jgi:LysM repeat protein
MNRKLPALWASVLAIAMVIGCLSSAPVLAGPPRIEKSVGPHADGLSNEGSEGGDERISAKERKRAEQTVTVEHGNTLWSIAAATLKTKRAGRIAGYWPRIYRANRAVIGPDPNFIMPGQVLALPSSQGRPDVRSNPSPSGDRASRRDEGNQEKTSSKVGQSQVADNEGSQDSAAQAPTQTSDNKEGTGTAPSRGDKATEGSRARGRYRVEFVVRDALFGYQVGSSIKLRYPDGEVRYFRTESGGRLRVDELPEGRYVAYLDVAGISSPLSFHLSRGRTVQLSVLTYWDLAAVVVGVCLLLLILALVRRSLRRLPRLFLLRRVRKRLLATRVGVEIGLRRLVAVCRVRMPSTQGWKHRTGAGYVRIHLKDGRLMEGWQDLGWRRFGNEEHVLLNVVMNRDDHGRAVGRPVDLLLRPYWVEVFHRDQISSVEHLPAPSCVVSIGQRAGSWKAACAGRMDIQAADKLAAVLDNSITTSNRRLRVDCSQVNDVDEAAISVLEQVVANCERRGVPFKASPAIARAAATAGTPRGKGRSEPFRRIAARSVLLPALPKHSARRRRAGSRLTTPHPGSRDRIGGTSTGQAKEGAPQPGRERGHVAGLGRTTVTPPGDAGHRPSSTGAVLQSELEDPLGNGGRSAGKRADGVGSSTEVRSD